MLLSALSESSVRSTYSDEKLSLRRSTLRNVVVFGQTIGVTISALPIHPRERAGEQLAHHRVTGKYRIHQERIKSTIRRPWLINVTKGRICEAEREAECEAVLVCVQNLNFR